MDTSRLPLAKPEPRKRTKRRRQRHEAKVKGTVREEVMERDGHRCRLSRSTEAQEAFGRCQGVVEWAHWGPWKRANTRKQAPERRHVRHGGLALCTGHHAAYDGRAGDRMTIKALTPDDCDGALRFSVGWVAWEEPSESV